MAQKFNCTSQSTHMPQVHKSKCL